MGKMVGSWGGEEETTECLHVSKKKNPRIPGALPHKTIATRHWKPESE